MKRLLILFLAVLLAVSAVLITSLAVGGRQEQLTHEEQILFGDPAAADGLEVSLRYGYRGYLQWFTDYTHGTPDHWETDFRCYAMQPNFSYSPLDYRGITMNVVGDYYGMDTLGDIFRMEVQAGGTVYAGMLAAYKELYDATPEGGLTNTYIRFGDHCDYYPLAGMFELPTGGFHWNPYSESRYLTNGKEVAEAFNAYFRIPVLEDDWLQVIVDKRSGSVSESVDVSDPRKGADHYSMGTVGICYENTAYFTFGALTQQGNTVDTSLIPGGYGLYSFTFDDRGNVNIGSLSTRLPLDPTFAPAEMQVDREFENLHYFSTRDGNTYLTVIDFQTMEILQQLCILEEEEDTWQYYRVQDGCIIGITGEEKVTVWQKNDRGLFEFRFTTALQEENKAYGLYDAVFAFDGQRLAIVNWAEKSWNPYENEDAVIVEKACGYNLSIYTEAGCAYRGQYISSLEPAERQWNDTRLWLHELKVRWIS